MTDRRVPDLSYGHLGEASYDNDEQKWYFSRNESSTNIVQAIQPFRQCIPPSVRLPSDEAMATEISQMRWLAKALPEAGPASGVLENLVRVSTNASPSNSIPSTLLAVGKAVDASHQNNSRGLTIFAMASGEAGNVLRLIKPKAENQDWDHLGVSNLQTQQPTAAGNGYWVETGGLILQISFASDTEGLSSWLAVRKSEFTTIFRPTFHRSPVPAKVPRHFAQTYPASLLNANPIITLNKDRTGGSHHADVAFNPWYLRQFAVLDQRGRWTIWNLEGHHGKRSVSPGHWGYIQDNGADYHHTPGNWGRILWAANFSTIVVCDRRHLTIFDLRTKPKRLRTPKIIGENSTDWILEARRSLDKLDQVFVLTTSRILLIRIHSGDGPGGDELDFASAEILLSCLHFRNAGDEATKLELLLGDEACTAFIYSTHSLLINAFRFSTPLEQATPASWTYDGTCLPMNNGPGQIVHSPLETLCFLPHKLSSKTGQTKGGEAGRDSKSGLEFYQLFSIDETLSLSGTLVATNSVTSRSLEDQLAEPQATSHLGLGTGHADTLSAYHVPKHDFIVADDVGNSDSNPEITEVSLIAASKKLALEARDSRALEFDARELFKITFYDNVSQTVSQHPTPSNSAMRGYIHVMEQGIQSRGSDGEQSFMLCAELSNFTVFSGDVDEGSLLLSGFVESMKHGGSLSNMAITLFTTSQFLVEKDANGSHNRRMPDLSHIYDRLVDLWVSCLPEKTPGLSRLATERMIRTIAAELYLSSLAVSIRDRTVNVPSAEVPQESIDLVLPVRGRHDRVLENRESRIKGKSKDYGFSAISAAGLLTPSRTPSLPSRDGDAAAEDPAEDPAITRLRCYAPSIISHAPLSRARSTILSHWPSIPGADPSKYSWETSKEAMETEADSDDEESWTRKEKAKRLRRRTERFLQRQNGKLTENAATQPVPVLLMGSQPDPVRQLASSQPEHPMTQPVGGTHGSRNIKRATGRRKGF